LFCPQNHILSLAQLAAADELIWRGMMLQAEHNRSNAQHYGGG